MSDEVRRLEELALATQKQVELLARELEANRQELRQLKPMGSGNPEGGSVNGLNPPPRLSKLRAMVSRRGFLKAAAGLAALTGGAALAGRASVSADAPILVNYQGRLTDPNGNPVTGTYNMRFALYSTATGGTALWSEDRNGANSVPVNNGLFNVMLGSVTPIQKTAFDGGSLYLGVTVGADPEMVPRQQLGAVPFAVQIPDTLTNKVISTDSTLDANASPSFTYHGLARQAIINGNFDIWQRGTNSGTLTTNAKRYMADRWMHFANNLPQSWSVTRQDGSGARGSRFCARVQRTPETSGIVGINLAQDFETHDSILFRGKKVSLAFYARAGSNFSASSSELHVVLNAGTGTDEDSYGGFTGLVTPINTTVALTQNWQRFTLSTSSAIGDGITQLGVRFYFTPTGTAGASDYFEIAQVQLCAGDVALPFQPKSLEEELRTCQRYCYVPDTSNKFSPIGPAIANSTTNAKVMVSLPVQMRSVPRLTTSPSDWALDDTTTTPYPVTALALEEHFLSRNVLALNASVASGLTPYRPYRLVANNTVGKLALFDAEL